MVLFTLLVVSLFAMLAIVLDLAALRQDRTGNRSSSDAAAAAAGLILREAGAVQACEDAWESFLSNTNEGSPVSAPPCASVFGAVCDPTVSREARGTAGDYTVTITNPVVDTSALMQPDVIGSQTQAIDSTLDGTACNRVGVHITQGRAPVFGTVIGADATTTSAHSVALSTIGGQQGDAVNMLLLDTTDCAVLVVEGKAKVLLKAVGATPGLVVVDSSGSKCPSPLSDFTVDAQGSNTAIRVDGPSSPSDNGFGNGRIDLFAMGAATSCAGGVACDPVDVSALRVQPQPTASDQRIGRAPIDHRYNCKSDYSVLDTAPYAPPNGDTWNVAACGGGSRAHIDDLRAAVGNTAGVNPSAGSFNQWTLGPDQTTGTADDLPCTVEPTTPLPASGFSGNWWIDCSTGFKVKRELNFTGGNIVTDGGIILESSGLLKVNSGNTLSVPPSCVTSFCLDSSSATGAYLYMRTGDFIKEGQAGINLDNVFVYQENSTIDLAGGDKPPSMLRWIAPRTGPFEDLLLWSEQVAKFSLEGQAALEIEGVFFTPRAKPFDIGGQGADDQASAQFISWDLRIRGNGTVVMEPDPNRIVLIPRARVELIR